MLHETLLFVYLIAVLLVAPSLIFYVLVEGDITPCRRRRRRVKGGR